MNPFSRFLAGATPDPALREFVVAWDELEALVIAVYRQGSAGAWEERRWRRMRPRVAEAYQFWAESLATFWPNARVAGEPAREDPFTALLAVARAADFAGNWQAMQTLPAAREALNRLLISRGEDAPHA